MKCFPSSTFGNQLAFAFTLTFTFAFAIQHGLPSHRIATSNIILDIRYSLFTICISHFINILWLHVRIGPNSCNPHITHFTSHTALYLTTRPMYLYEFDRFEL